MASIANANTVSMTGNDYELLQRIEIERSETISKAEKLAQLHAEYKHKLDILKSKIAKLKQRQLILEQNATPQAIGILLKEKEVQYKSFCENKALRSHDEKQLKGLVRRNCNLKIVVESLSKQLKMVINQMLHQNRQADCHEVGDNMIPYAMHNNAYFKDILNSNRTLERQIKFIRHIIQKETERNKDNNIRG
eukprot:870314_1